LYQVFTVLMFILTFLQKKREKTHVCHEFLGLITSL
jgi:hypothetical protein